MWLLFICLLICLFGCILYPVVLRASLASILMDQGSLLVGLGILHVVLAIKLNLALCKVAPYTVVLDSNVKAYYTIQEMGPGLSLASRFFLMTSIIMHWFLRSDYYILVLPLDNMPVFEYILVVCFYAFFCLI